MRRLLLVLPLLAFLLVLGTIGLGLLRPEERLQQSRLVGQGLPAFSTPPMLPGRPGVDAAGLSGGGPKLLNVFASWCVPCAAEAPSLLALEEEGFRIEAIAIRDKPDDVRRFLDEHGDPFAGIGDDRHSQVQLALGSAGVPETFLVDGEGVIRFHHIGPILEPQMAEIRRAAGQLR